MTHYFINDNNLKSNIKKLEINIMDNNYPFFTDNGIFAKRGLDFGTRLLISSLPINNIKGTVLDLGCGYGAIGIFLALKTQAKYIHMVDINRRAIHLAKMNIKENKVNNAKVYESNVYSKIDTKFDYIVTNPPIRAGKKVVYSIVFDAIKYLKNDGELWLVVRKDQGAKSLIKDMEKVYRTEIIDKSKGFFVISAKIR